MLIDIIPNNYNLRLQLFQTKFILTANYLIIPIMTQRRLWTPQEDQIITILVRQHGTKKWTTVAEQMKRTLNDKSRSSKQIRERWYNHLDPSVNKKQWSSQEEKILFDYHRQFGSKWKQIANKLRGRTDNHVKNYFYSTMRRALRRVNKFLGSKNSTSQMRTIRPSILSYLLDLADIDSQIRILVSRILQLSKFKPTKSYKSVFDDEQKQNYQTAIKKLMEINENYSKNGVKCMNEIQNFKINQKTPQSTQVDLKQATQDHQQRLEQQQLDQKSWQDENVQSYNCLMPEIQKPQYQCQLLVKKQQNFLSTNNIQLCISEYLEGLHSTETINLFQF